MAKPKIDFIGIGATKAGTTWISRMLDAHPDICMSEPKEIRYFNYFSGQADKYIHKNRKGLFFNKNHGKPLSWYEKHFCHCKEGQIRGEFSPTYLTDEKAPVAIKNYNPNVKLIVSLRNPIDRTYSHYWMQRSYLKREKRTFEEAIRGNSLYIEKEYYYKQLRRYLKYFKREQIMIVLFDDIKNQPKIELRKIYKFLGVNDSILPKNLREKSNYAKKARWVWFSKIMNFVPRFLVRINMIFVVRLLKKLKVNRMMLRLGTTKITYPKMNLETREYLRNVFKDDIKNLEILLDRNFAHWV